ncbi:hypothetical protein GWI33_004910 [Rhynchophorus ferrugineus]|uniref:Homeobox domain-containing protein n=1 Tax=Rhynchophorus ferrugineus TaxID=354439 RepID=A0A834II68_RHYFE|nr:hypothetical protein GWI33_004910 [Rhynchophorus ferrugineus]
MPPLSGEADTGPARYRSLSTRSPLPRLGLVRRVPRVRLHLQRCAPLKTITGNVSRLSRHGQNTLSIFNSRQQPKKKRKSRTAFTNHQIFELEKRFLYQKYLSPADRDEIALNLGLTNAQVITWFQNRRAKLKRDMEELKKDVESAKLLTAHKSFLENVQDLGILKKKAVVTEEDCPKNLVINDK